MLPFTAFIGSVAACWDLCWGLPHISKLFSASPTSSHLEQEKEHGMLYVEFHVGAGS